MLFRKKCIVSENHAKQINTICDQNTVSYFNFKAGGTCSKH
jgi:hypothetical protein